MSSAEADEPIEMPFYGRTRVVSKNQLLDGGGSPVGSGTLGETCADSLATEKYWEIRWNMDTTAMRTFAADYVATYEFHTGLQCFDAVGWATRRASGL